MLCHIQNSVWDKTRHSKTAELGRDGRNENSHNAFSRTCVSGHTLHDLSKTAGHRAQQDGRAWHGWARRDVKDCSSGRNVPPAFKTMEKTFLGVSLEAQTKENSLNRLESTNKETHGPSVVICCFSNGLLISICKCPRTRCIQIVDKYKYEPTSWPRNQEHRAASSE